MIYFLAHCKIAIFCSIYTKAHSDCAREHVFVQTVVVSMCCGVVFCNYIFINGEAEQIDKFVKYTIFDCIEI